MTIAYPHLAARIFNAPLLIHPAKLEAIIAGLGARLLGAGTIPETSERSSADADGQPLPAELFTTRRGQVRRDDAEGTYYRLRDGVAVIEAMGALAHRTSMTADSSMILGYQQIARNIDAAVADPEAHAILLHLDSPGGEVAGAFELADHIRAANARKPVFALADSLAASAGYLIVSGAKQIAVAPTGYVGSIGVVMTHVDLSRALANDGIAVTHIFAGEHKVDGTPYQPLAEPTRARFQSEIDAIYAQFVATVADARGLDPAAVRATQAAVYRAENAVQVGLADRIATAETLITELAASRPRSYPVGQPARSTADMRKQQMSDNPQAGGNQQPTITQADLEAAEQIGAESERTRIFAILDSEAAKDRPQAALALARKPQIDADTAAVLAGLPAEPVSAAAPEPRESEFEKHMRALGNPRVTPDDEQHGQAPTAGQLWDQVVARHQH